MLIVGQLSECLRTPQRASANLVRPRPSLPAAALVELPNKVLSFYNKWESVTTTGRPNWIVPLDAYSERNTLHFHLRISFRYQHDGPKMLRNTGYVFGEPSSSRRFTAMGAMIFRRYPHSPLGISRGLCRLFRLLTAVSSFAFQLRFELKKPQRFAPVSQLFSLRNLSADRPVAALPASRAQRAVGLPAVIK